MREVVMSYRDYKNQYSDCKTKKGSYNKDTKEVTVIVPDNHGYRKWRDLNPEYAEICQILANVRKEM